MGLLFGQSPFTTFYQSKQGQDTRFLITSPASGCMLYYDSASDKFVNSNSLLFDASTFTFSVHQIDTDFITTGGISLTGTFADASSDVGSAGQYLTSTGTGTNWVTLPTIGNGTLTITPGTFLTGGVLTFTANQSGSSSLSLGTNATNLNTASTIVARDSSGNFSAGTITASLTGSASLVAVTSSATATNFPVVFATASSSASLLNETSLTYNPSTNTLVTTNINATTFTGSLTGSATLIDTTAQTTGTFFIPFVPLSTTQSSGQVVSVQSKLFYVVGEDQLNIGTTAGLTGDNIPLALLNNTLANNEYNNIQLGFSSAVYKNWLIGVRNNTTSTDTIFTISPYGVPQDTFFYIDGYGKTSSDVIEGQTNLQTLDTNLTGETTKYYTDTGLIYVEDDGNVQGNWYSNRIGGHPSLNGTFGFQIGNNTSGAQLILGDTATNQWAATTANSTYKLFSDNFDPAGLISSFGYLYELTRYGINRFYTNNYQYIPLDMPIMEIDSLPFLYSPCVPNTLTGFVSPVVRSGGANIYDITIKVSGNNPFGRTITISNQVAFNFTQTATNSATFPTSTADINYTRGTPTMTINGGSFIGFVFTSTFNGTNYTYQQSAVSVWDIFQPVGQVTCVITPTNTGNEIDTYVLTIDFNINVTAVTGVTRAARTGNLDGSFVTLKGTSIVAVTSRTSGSGTLTLDATPTNTLLTAVRSGGNELQLTCPIISATTSITGGTISGTTITASTQFTGAGTGLTGTASSLKVGTITITSSSTNAEKGMLYTSDSATGDVKSTAPYLTYNPSNDRLTSYYLNQTANGGFLVATTITITDAFPVTYDYFDIVFTVDIATAGAVIQFDVSPSASALWTNTYVQVYNTTVPVTQVVNNTAQTNVIIGSVVNGSCMFKLTYTQSYRPLVMWSGFIQDATGNGTINGQARYTGAATFANAVFTCATSISGSYSVRGYN